MINGLRSSSYNAEVFYEERLPSEAEIPLGAIHGQQLDKEYKEYLGDDIQRVLRNAGLTWKDLAGLDDMKDVEDYLSD